jgi:hypothetical protein
VNSIGIEAVMKAFKIIDSSILDVRTLTLGTPLIYLARKDQNLMPLSVFGESLNRVADLFLKYSLEMLKAG